MNNPNLNELKEDTVLEVHAERIKLSDAEAAAEAEPQPYQSDLWMSGEIAEKDELLSQLGPYTRLALEGTERSGERVPGLVQRAADSLEMEVEEMEVYLDNLYGRAVA